ncbi:IS110 family transposase [Verminephrobacter aporrectodeae subsp. tuberculatae]|uniref:IS110 family transposase n=1 Tax=Verminephrobacter aporrectodeae subsp. tuberculatae TaxID=1110392 RepID=A0ABT3KUC3_9BURK|nr:IS110 family transposase [Verminephrobacter aporrectodeae]MCW5321939.1 IS110 family transposase [Verminephrobacter aporrectodeae subsp. tuberculatae]MCW8199660.1 IS110 family transposase [Verminephrobacter aporrectodeae subsp. tuberculatae]
MELTPMYKRVIALDVHQAKITACAIIEHEDGRLEEIKQDFGAFKRDRRALAQWALQIRPEVTVMESTGVYWKSPFAALEAVGIIAWVVNARHVKAVPGRKTDVADAQWLATLARAGLLRASFVPPAQMRQLRLVARQRQKLVGMCSAEKNRLHKVLVDAGIRLNVLVSDIHGHSARGMIKSLIQGRPLHEILDDKGRLRASREALGEALSTEQWSDVHRFVADEIMQHIEQIEQRIKRMDEYLLQGLRAYKPQLNLLQTIPGIDQIGAAMLLVEISTDMTVFGSAERLASWVGICPGNNESAGKRKSGRIRRGNAWVRRLLCEFAQAAARTRCAFKAKFESLASRKGYKKSIIALAHKMLRTIYAMLATATCYQDRSIDYEALSVARNAPRWLKMLRKHGFIAASPAV